MKPEDRALTEAQLTRIEHMIEEFRAAKQRQLVQRAKKLWRRAEAIQRLAELEADPEQVH